MKKLKEIVLSEKYRPVLVKFVFLEKNINVNIVYNVIL